MESSNRALDSTKAFVGLPGAAYPGQILLTPGVSRQVPLDPPFRLLSLSVTAQGPARRQLLERQSESGNRAGVQQPIHLGDLEGIERCVG